MEAQVLKGSIWKWGTCQTSYWARQASPNCQSEGCSLYCQLSVTLKSLWEARTNLQHLLKGKLKTLTKFSCQRITIENNN